MGVSSLKLCAWGNVPFHIPSTFDHGIYISSLISLYSGVLKPSYQRALLLTSLFDISEGLYFVPVNYLPLTFLTY